MRLEIELREVQRSLMKTCYRNAEPEGSPSNRTTTLSTQPMQEWLRDKPLNFLEWSSHSPDLNLIKHFWRDLKIAVQRRSPSNRTELEGICRDEWAKLPNCRCAKLVVSYPRKTAIIAAKGASTKY